MKKLVAALLLFAFSATAAAAGGKPEILSFHQGQYAKPFLAIFSNMLSVPAGVRVSATQLDLNGDGRPEYAFRLQGKSTCTKGDHCLTLVVEKVRDGYRKLLQTTAKTIVARPAIYNGYRQMVVDGQTWVAGQGQYVPLLPAGVSRVRFNLPWRSDMKSGPGAYNGKLFTPALGGSSLVSGKMASIDLNGDGLNEYIYFLTSTGCGALLGCPVAVMTTQGQGPERPIALLTSKELVGVGVKGGVGGWRDLWFSNGLGLVLYRFNGRAYVPLYRSYPKARSDLRVVEASASGVPYPENTCNFLSSCRLQAADPYGDGLGAWQSSLSDLQRIRAVSVPGGTPTVGSAGSDWPNVKWAAGSKITSTAAFLSSPVAQKNALTHLREFQYQELSKALGSAPVEAIEKRAIAGNKKGPAVIVEVVNELGLQGGLEYLQRGAVKTLVNGVSLTLLDPALESELGRRLPSNSGWKPKK